MDSEYNPPQTERKTHFETKLLAVYTQVSSPCVSEAYCVKELCVWKLTLRRFHISGSSVTDIKLRSIHREDSTYITFVVTAANSVLSPVSMEKGITLERAEAGQRQY